MAQAIVTFKATAGVGGANLQRFVYDVTFCGDDVSEEIAIQRQLEIEVTAPNDFTNPELDDDILAAVQAAAVALGITVTSTNLIKSKYERLGSVASGTVTISAGETTADVVYTFPRVNANYEVKLQPLQGGTYDYWPTLQTTQGFRLNIFPAAVGVLNFSYFVIDKSFSILSGEEVVLARLPAAWFRYNIGITSAGSLVSQWDDQSGNGRHGKQAVGTNQPTKQADGSILFDGTDNFLKCDAFTLIQPETVYILGKMISWSSGDVIFDGNVANSGLMNETAVTPTVALFAGGSNVPLSTSWVVGTYAAVAAVFNGAASIVQVNTTTSETANPGAANMGGFTLGALATGAVSSNIQVKEVIVFPDAHDDATRLSVINYLLTL